MPMHGDTFSLKRGFLLYSMAPLHLFMFGRGAFFISPARPYGTRGLPAGADLGNLTFELLNWGIKINSASKHYTRENFHHC